MKKYISRMIVILVALSVINRVAIPVSVQAKEEEVSQRTVRVAMLHYPNFIDYDQNGNPSGFACDYLNELAKYTDWNYEYVPASFKDAQKMLIAGELDIIPGTQYTDERAVLYDYSNASMLLDSNVLCVPKDNTTYYYNDFKELDGKKIGVMAGSIRKEQFSDVLNREGVSVQFLEFDTNDDEIAALTNGEVSAILMSMIRCTPDYRIIASTNPTDVYFTTNPNDSTIKAGIDQAQEEILSMNPYYGLQLAQKHYGSIQRAYAFTDEERKFMDNSPVITVAVATDSSPIEYYDTKTNSFQGLVVDYFEKISEITGIKFRYVSRGDKNSIIKDMNNGTLQILATATNGINIEDIYPITLTDSYVQNSVSLVYNSKIEEPLNKDCRIALKSGFVYFQDLAEEQGYSDSITFDTFSECVNAVNKGEADVTYLPAYSATGITGHAYFQNVKVFSSEIADYDCAIGVSNQCDPMLVSILDKSLASIPTAEKELMDLSAISNNMTEKTWKDIFYENLTTFLIAIVIICALIGIMAILLASRRKKTNQKLAEAVAKAERADGEKTAFLARMSHDMRTPMNTITNLTRMVEGELDHPENALADLKHMETANQFLLGLIEDILDVSRIESGKLVLHPERYSYSEFLEYINYTFMPIAKERGIELTISPGTEYVDIMIDKVRFNQVCFNLISNALKYTEPGGHIKLLMEHGEVKDDLLPCTIMIEDDGIGMSKEFQENMFQAFTQEGRSFKTVEGAGLGLSIVKKILDCMGGTISVQSELGKGSVFIVKLVMVLAPKEEQCQKETIDYIILQGKHLLLVEDHPLNQQIAKRLLEKQGMTVEIVNNGQQAIEVFQDHASDFDAVLMDIRMPIMDGLSATKGIRALDVPKAKIIPIIAMTANAYDSDIEECMKAGMNAHISKPIEPKKMYQVIGSYLR